MTYAETFKRYQSDFSWNADAKTWCLSGTDKDGNYWETDDYDAPGIAQARRDAVEYLREFNSESGRGLPRQPQHSQDFA